MIKAELNNDGKCRKVALHECFGKMGKMINQGLVEACIKYIELELHILIAECDAVAVGKSRCGLSTCHFH